jgi:non-ribosomal peptide synthetase component F
MSAKPSPEMIVGFLAILLAGACCVPIDPDYPADRLALLLEDCDPETALATADSTQTFSGAWKGKVLSMPHVARALDLLPNTRIINGYRPTENTNFTTCHRITRADLEKASIPIGRPVSNTTVYLLNADLRRVPVGIPGELFTGGDGLAIGYHRAPELTAEKFITHPRFGRLYRPGDLCRRAEDGTIEFIGRRDRRSRSPRPARSMSRPCQNLTKSPLPTSPAPRHRPSARSKPTWP